MHKVRLGELPASAGVIAKARELTRELQAIVLEKGAPPFRESGERFAPEEKLQDFANILNGLPPAYEADGTLGELSAIGRMFLRQRLEGWTDSGGDWENEEAWTSHGVDPFQEQISLKRTVTGTIWLLKGKFGRHEEELARAVLSLGVQDANLEPGSLYSFGELEGINEQVALARLCFVRFLLNEHLHMWGGRCDRCKSFYVRKRLNHKRYCSKACKHTFTSAKSKADRHARKLAVARAEILSWEALPAEERKENGRKWKVWVAEKTSKEGCTVQWITRYVNTGELTAPANDGDVRR